MCLILRDGLQASQAWVVGDPALPFRVTER